MKFTRALAAGNTGQSRVVALLEAAGHLTAPNDGPRRGLSSWDLWVGCPARSFQATAEIKTDLKAAQTGNLAVEVWNPRADRPSGLTATAADLWVVVSDQVWACRTADLRRVAAGPLPPGGRLVRRAGDGNATLLVFPTPWLLTAARFARLDQATVKAILKL